MNCPLVYLAATESPTAAEWLSHVTLEEVTQNVLSGETSLPGLALRAVEPPSELLAAAPELPQLNICTVTGGTLQVPSSLVQLWGTHDVHGPSFEELLKEIVDEFGEPQVEKKREGEDGHGGLGPSPKRRRTVPQLEVLACDALPAQHLAQGAISNLKKDLSGKLLLRVGLDSAWWLLNTAAAPLTLPAGTQLAGFGPGTFKHVPREAEGKLGETDSQMVLFHLHDSAGNVMHNGKLVSLGELVMAAHKMRATCEVCYHETTAAPQASDAGAFTLVRKHEVYYKPAPKATAHAEEGNLEVKGTQSMAALVPVAKLDFEGKGLAAVLWACKWAMKALTPIKPLVALVCDVEIPANSAVKLTT